jgi:hypothetical protein
MRIIRQHAETDIQELAGSVCHGALGVGTSVDEGVTALFLNTDGTWHRIYIDAGVLFWEPGEPDPSVELAENEEFLDLLKPLGATSLKIEYVRMQSGELRVTFMGQHRLVLAEEESGLLRVQIH